MTKIHGQCGCDPRMDAGNQAKIQQSFTKAYEGALQDLAQDFSKGLEALAGMLKNIVQLKKQLAAKQQGAAQGGQQIPAHIAAMMNGGANRPGDAKADAPAAKDINVDVDVDVDVNVTIDPGKPGKPAHDCKPEKPEVDGKVEVTQGRIWGDPHFVGADGGKYDVQGEAGKTYNILSDTGVQMNATFKEWNNPGTTVVEQVGITTDKGTVQVNEDGSLELKEIVGQTKSIPPQNLYNTTSVAKGEAGSYMGGAVTVNDKGHVTVKAGEYDITFDKFSKNDKAGAWINNIELRSADANSDGNLPTGLWGATVDGDGHARNGDAGKGTQGGGAIDGLDGKVTEKGDKETVKLYEVGNIFDTNFSNFNEFKAEGQGGHDCAPPPPPHCPPEHPPAQPPEVDGEVKVEHGRIWGDPHFVGADGGKYDVQGEAGKTYNILSDTGVQMNATFKEWNNPGTTVVEQVGISTDGGMIQVNADGSVILGGDAVIAPGAEGDYGPVTVNDKGHVTVTAGEYTITFDNFAKNDKSGEWINNIKIRSDDANSDGVLPSGLWGVTVDGDGQARNGDRGKGTQGGGAIEGLNGEITAKGDKDTVKLYEVGGLFDTDFTNFNVANPGGTAPVGHYDGAAFTWDLNVGIDLNVDVLMGGETIATKEQRLNLRDLGIA